VRDRSAVDGAVAATDAIRPVDVLVDCAGVSHGRNSYRLDPAEWERVIASI